MKKEVRKFLRYISMFLVIFIATQYIPDCNISNKTSFIVATIAVVTFAILDMYFPIVVTDQ